MFASLEQNTYTLIIYAVHVDKVLFIIIVTLFTGNKTRVSYVLYYTKERANVINETQNFEGLEEEQEIL
jgi:hypothetical protein